MRKALIGLAILILVTGFFAIRAQQNQEGQPDAVPEAGTQNYEDGTYRGSFIDRGHIQVNLQFTLEDNTVDEIEFRHLAYRDTDYMEEDEEDETIAGLRAQYEEAMNYLIDKDIRESLDDLYEPDEVITENEVVADTFTAATVRTAKIRSAVRDALNRGVYVYN